MIDQMTVLLENEKGRLAALCRVLADENINMHALMVADTTDFGIVRIICDAPAKATAALQREGYRAMTTPVAAIETPNVPGGFANVLEFFEKCNANVEYAYCFGTPNSRAVSVLKISDGQNLLEELNAAGYKALQPEDIYAPDAI